MNIDEKIYATEGNKSEVNLRFSNVGYTIMDFNEGEPNKQKVVKTITTIK